MSVIATMVLFGLLVPILNYISNLFRGNLSEEAKKVQKEYTQKHPAIAIIGLLIGLIPAIAYWVYVFTQL